jgi:hypothetical protein
VSCNTLPTFGGQRRGRLLIVVSANGLPRELSTAAATLLLLAALSGCAAGATGIDREAAGAASRQGGPDADLARLLDPTRAPVEVDSAGPRDFGEFNRALVASHRH